MVRLRLKRFGRTHKPFYRLNAIDQRSPRDGKPIEQLGFYDPTHKDDAKQVSLNEDRIRYWLGVGAQPSDTVRDLLVKAGIVDKATGKATAASE
ncbi:MAG: 30S ribosomal protein S16 [Planctomycetota bacterium]